MNECLNDGIPFWLRYVFDSYGGQHLVNNHADSVSFVHITSRLAY